MRMVNCGRCVYFKQTNPRDSGRKEAAGECLRMPPTVALGSQNTPWTLRPVVLEYDTCGEGRQS